MTIAPALTAALLIAGTVASVAGVAISTSANVNAANYQAQIADRNAAINADNANRAIARSQQEQADQDRRTSLYLGTQLAEQAASGLKLGGRSFMLTRKSARELGRMDALNVRQAGEVEAQNYRVASSDSAQAADFSRSQASSSLLEGFFNAGSSIIGGATGIAKSGGIPSILGARKTVGNVYAGAGAMAG